MTHCIFLVQKLDGYIDTDAEPIHLIDTITRVFEGGCVISPRIAESISKSFVLMEEKIKVEEKNALTERERDVLTLVAKGLTNREIGGALFVSDSTAKAHLHRILKKLTL